MSNPTQTEEDWNEAEAADIAVLVESGGTSSHILLVDSAELDRPLALELAKRLITLAERLPDPPRILRRRADVDEHYQRAADTN